MKTTSKSVCCSCINLIIMTTAIWVSTTLFLAQGKGEALRHAKLVQEARMKGFLALLDRDRQGAAPLDPAALLARNLDAPGRIKAIFGGSAAIYLGKVSVSSTLTNPDGSSAAGAPLPPEPSDAIYRLGRPYRGELLVCGVPTFVAYDPLVDAKGKVVGVLYVGQEKSQCLAPYDAVQRRVVLMSAALNLVLALLLLFFGRQRSRAERALGERERQNKAILDNIPDLAWLKDRKGKFTAVNDAFGRACGKAPETLRGKDDFEVWPAALAQRYLKEDLEVLCSGLRRQSDEPIINSEGNTIWTEAVRTPIFNEQGDIIGLSGIARDITDRRRIETCLQDSEATLRQIFNNVHDAIILHRLDGSSIRFNETALKMYGLSEEQALVLSLPRDLSAEDNDFALLQAHYERVREGETCHFEWKARRPGDGSTFQVEIFLCTLRLTDEELVLLTVTDITRRKLDEARMKHALSVLSATLESTGDGILVLDRENRVLRYNNRFIEMMHFEPGVRVPQEKGDGHLLERVSDPVPLLRDLAAEDADPHLVGQIVLTLKDGRVIERVSHPQLVDGSIVGRVLSYRDVTEEKKLESQLRHAQKMEALGTLTGGIAHDFNNILTIIIGCSSLMQLHTEQDTVLNDYLEQIMAAAEKAAGLTRGLLAYSRRQRLEPKPVDLNGIVGALDTLLSRLIGEDVALETRIFPQALVVLADSGQMEQVLMNLATNARDAMCGVGSLKIETAAVRLDLESIAQLGFGEPGSYALLTVTDTGNGMDSATQERIFEPFFTTKGVGSGTGLGLSIVYGIMKQHNGYITVRSEPGAGTTFELYLPLTDCAGDGALAAVPAATRCGSETILLIEDDEELRSLFSDVLSRNGYRIIEAADGEEGVEKFREHQDTVSLVLVDVVMPKKNGKETFAEICQIREGMQAIFMSGYTDDIINRKGIEEGRLNFLSKPLAPSDLLEKIRQVLDEGA